MRLKTAVSSRKRVLAKFYWLEAGPSKHILLLLSLQGVNLGCRLLPKALLSNLLKEIVAEIVGQNTIVNKERPHHKIFIFLIVIGKPILAVASLPSPIFPLTAT